MTVRYFLGVDGGGTKTQFVCIDDAGNVVASHREPTTYHLQVGLDGAERVLRAGVAVICGTLGISPTGFAYVFFGLPAFGEDDEVDPQLDRLCGDILGHARYRCGNDMVCGWAGSLACEDGINIVAGTGSIGYGERQGRAARVGGWGEVFGDEGSAYWIAIQGLDAFARMSDGRLAKGPLHEGFREALHLDTDLGLCAAIMGEHGLTRDAIAGLAPIVAAAADRGDRAARAIHRHAAIELAGMADALRRTLGFADTEQALLSWSGGVLNHVAAVREAFCARLDRSGGYCVIEPRHEPGYGAALYARHLHKNAASA
ncbi:N-acetylglucosamine kinase-like BadF-type ATPase [Hephaestia caeni]|uniref:N-acetylglucosamine kinase-like BadF-type ATPase n=1 Tax=Hephaestia caeni TaxID=645617 RepID=A0A397NQY5_9SPHN|nr:BadF/BadG/BcrA/BcrD ATPase family protein [Hephaestia caeni]RIA37175.1 N-acetylglucosamine kinase-like BadF-type ATPase [Hephaestia caeni]